MDEKEIQIQIQKRRIKKMTEILAAASKGNLEEWLVKEVRTTIKAMMFEVMHTVPLTFNEAVLVTLNFPTIMECIENRIIDGEMMLREEIIIYIREKVQEVKDKLAKAMPEMDESIKKIKKHYEQQTQTISPVPGLEKPGVCQ